MILFATAASVTEYSGTFYTVIPEKEKVRAPKDVYFGDISEKDALLHRNTHCIMRCFSYRRIL